MEYEKIQKSTVFREYMCPSTEKSYPVTLYGIFVVFWDLCLDTEHYLCWLQILYMETTHYK